MNWNRLTLFLLSCSYFLFLILVREIYSQQNVWVAGHWIKAIFLSISFLFTMCSHKTRLIIKTGFDSNNWINTIHLAWLSATLYR